MVYFSCAACGNSLKKNQVDKHRNSCYSSVSCLDCGTEFSGNSYQSHIKCITEDEKYCGKDYKPKVNKGEAKQEEWIKSILEVTSETSVKPELKALLDHITTFSNIPRKQKKFENFIRNSVPYVRDNLLSQAWEIFSKAQEKSKPNNTQQNNTKKEEALVNVEAVKRKCDSEKQDSTPSKKIKTDETPEAEDEISEIKRKFNWEDTIVDILKKKNNKLSMAKLQKKVLAQYYQFYSLEDTTKEEKLIAKFNKKISSSENLEVTENNKVNLLAHTNGNS